MESAKISPRSQRLEIRLIEKPWGRTDLPMFGAWRDCRIGEVWFQRPDGDDLPLLAKYLFTSEKLSVQVHPDDAHAQGRGKNECWYIVDAAEDAAVGLGLSRPLAGPDLAAAARDGSIEELLQWRRVKAGDFVYVPAGTVHAIGAGIALVEFQQNSDITYRLYDYGRSRELHVEEAAAVATADYDFERHFRAAGDPLDCVLADTPELSLIRATTSHGLPSGLVHRRRWVIPLEGTAAADGISVSAGGCLLAEAGAALTVSPAAVLLIGVEGKL